MEKMRAHFHGLRAAAIHDAFTAELSDAGISEAEKKVFISGIPIRA